MDALSLPAENVYFRRALRSMLFLVFNSAIRILQLIPSNIGGQGAVNKAFELPQPA